MKVLTAAQMRDVDRRTIEEVGIPVVALMENAGRAVAEAAWRALPGLERRSLVVVCGRGHNGGDGLVAARHLANRGARPAVVLLGRVEELKSEVVRGHARALRRWGIPIDERPDAAATASSPPLGHFEVIVDAIFGTGFNPPASGFEAVAIEQIRDAHRAGRSVIAVDLPSGLSADRGAVDGPAAEADLTVTFAAAKIAHWMAPADRLCGRVEVADISIPHHLVERPEHTLELVEPAVVAGLVEPRRPDTHKGTYGHLLVVAGSFGKTGAAILAGRAALQAGAGLVTVATPRSCLPLVAAGAAELMTEPLPETGSGTIAEAALERILELLAERDALALGPGLTTAPETAALVRTLVSRLDRPAVIDADALNALAGISPPLGDDPRPWILTPHPGEAARLLGQPTSEINRDRLAAATVIARTWRSVAVLKGHRTVTASADGRQYLNPTGNPGLASAGTGDVLTGLVGGLLAQRIAAEPAALLGVYLHGLAGDLAAARRGQASLIASDVLDSLPEAFTTIASGARG